MKLLLIEDDEYKAEQIQNHLIKDGHIVNMKGSFQSGMREILAQDYELILLDMSIPTFDSGSRHRPFGGKDVLKEMGRRKINIPVVVVTQYSVFGEGRDNITLQELGESLKKEFTNNYQGMIYFDASSADWLNKLKVILEEMD